MRCSGDGAWSVLTPKVDIACFWNCPGNVSEGVPVTTCFAALYADPADMGRGIPPANAPMVDIGCPIESFLVASPATTRPMADTRPLKYWSTASRQSPVADHVFIRRWLTSNGSVNGFRKNPGPLPMRSGIHADTLDPNPSSGFSQVGCPRVIMLITWLAAKVPTTKVAAVRPKSPGVNRPVCKARGTAPTSWPTPPNSDRTRASFHCGARTPSLARSAPVCPITLLNTLRLPRLPKRVLTLLATCRAIS